MPLKKKTKKSVLGKNLIYYRNKAKKKSLKDSTRHTQDLGDGYDYTKFSITEENNVEKFFINAEINKKKFQTERQNVKLINLNNVESIDKNKLDELNEKYNEFKEFLRIPQRPKWNSNTTNEDLQSMEYKTFIEWRKNLSKIEKTDLICTPFEKNLELWRQLWRVLERSDLIVQIINARNPLMFYCEDIELYTKKLSSNKENLLLVNKSDFLNNIQRKYWAKYFESKKIKAIFFSALEKKIKINNDKEISDSEIFLNQKNQSFNILKKIENLEIKDDFKLDKLNYYLSEGRLFNRSELIKVLQSYKIKLEKFLQKEYLTVGLVGYPNVGKSSTINALIECKKVSISSTPGKTKHFQTIFLDKELCLCDCPGLVFPNFVTSKAEMFLNGILSIDQIKDYRPTINLLTQKIPLRVFQNKYSLILSSNQQENEYLTSDQLLNSYALMKGYVTGRGLPDHVKAAKCIVKDFISGYILYCYSPPNVAQNLYQPFDDCIKKFVSKHITPSHQRILNDSITKENFDKLYFEKNLINYRIKGINGINQVDQNLNISKPWKEINKLKRNKREKLRRLFRNLDEH